MDLTRAFEWTSLAGAQNYYLYIGSSVGARDLVNTGEIQQTSYLVPALPTGRTLYARLYTRFDGVWRHTQISFTAAPLLVARFIYPMDGTTNVDLLTAFEWTGVENAQAYYLYVGTTPGARDLVDTGEILRTRTQVPDLPAGRTLYARIHAKVAGIWRHTEISFTAAPPPARFVHPLNAASNADLNRPIEWTAAPSAQAYWLTIGTSLGTRDLLDSGSLRQTVFSITRLLPDDRPLYARLGTQQSGRWRHVDIVFSAASQTARFLHPRPGATNVDSRQPFRWTAVPRAEAYQLIVETTPGARDLVNTSELLQTSFVVASLPTDRILYSRVRTKVNGAWRHSDAVFTSQPSVAPAVLTYPVDRADNVDSGQPFQWLGTDIAQGYRLDVGTTAGGQDLHTSGEIRTTRRFVPDLPLGIPLFARLSTKMDGQWYSSDYTFTVTRNVVSMTTRFDQALWATDAVRRMADRTNTPHIGTELSALVSAGLRPWALCGTYTLALEGMLRQLNLGASFRYLNLAFNSNGYDIHILMELFHTDLRKWVPLDPTFGVVMKRTSDGAWASAEDVMEATRSRRWQDVTYVFLGPYSNRYARDYYLDYPLLYLNVYHFPDPLVVGEGQTPLPYLREVGLPVTGGTGVYIVRCDAGSEADVIINGRRTTVSCNGVDSLSVAFFASSITVPEGSSGAFRIYQPLRFVF